MGRTSVIGLTLAALLAGAGVAQAQRSSLWNTCTGAPDVDWDVQVKSCGALIGSPQESVSDRADAYNNRGNAWEAKGDHDRAIADFSAAIRLVPTHGKAFNNRGISLAAKGDLDRALADYNEAIRLEPDALAYNNRAIVWSDKGNLDRAIADYSEAVRIDPKYALAYTNRAFAWTRKGDLDRALSDFDEVVRLQPKSAAALNNRGTGWAAKGDVTRALADYTAAIKVNAREPDAFINRGRLLFGRGDFAAAAEDLATAGQMTDDAYTMLWLFIARGRDGQARLPELESGLGRLLITGWPVPIIAFYLGRQSADEMQRAAETGDQRCEAQFYLGEWHLIGWHVADGKAALKRAREICPKSFVEYAGAAAELARLGP